MHAPAADSPLLPRRAQPVIAAAIVLALAAMGAWYLRESGRGRGLVHHDMPPPATGSFTVNVNAATALELAQLPGLGPTTAQRIVDHRREHGPFASVDALLEVPGIGPATVEQLRGHLRPIRPRKPLP